MNKVRVRFAPSPTGYLHIGGLRTALYDSLFARKNEGEFILKIEDTDQKRFVEGAVESLIKSLKWTGINWDEGVFAETEKLLELSSKSEKSKNYPGIIEIGECGPYIQSEKLEVYKKYAEQLVKDGHAYYCFCEPERLDEMRKEQQALKKPPIYDRHCLNLSKEEIEERLSKNFPHTIRLKIPRSRIIPFKDWIRGEIEFNTDLIDDQVLLKSDGYPTYHLANVVDDHEMKITHVIRGEEWLPSVPKHLLLYEFFGWEPPIFSHLPLILNTDKSKLSKRQGDVAVEDYIKKGYLKEAIINFVAFLGWNPGEGSTKEIFTLEELIKEFSLGHVHKGGAVFDIKKLDWINSQWIKKISIDDLYGRSLEFWQQKEFYNSAHEEKKSEEFIKKVLTIEQDRLTTLSEVGESNLFFFKDIDYEKNLLRWKETTIEQTKSSLQKSLNVLINISESAWIKEDLEKTLLEVAGDRRGDLLWPLRAALSGEKNHLRHSK